MLKPLNNRVVIEPDPEQKETSFGIVLVDAKEKPGTGTVLVGNKEIKKGQRVVFSKYAYDEVEVEGQKVYLVADTNVLAIFA